MTSNKQVDYEIRLALEKCLVSLLYASPQSKDKVLMIANEERMAGRHASAVILKDLVERLWPLTEIFEGVDLNCL